ncbi:medium-chain acyl-CoA ligase ACSF2, mitochondrial-like [Amphiura filiformis]|uniref:medium-chain acyl-CoA ligase ACSF2, mitochondrial-like n=1 Tax=Amphiura filiformis TaxID=82378 RepID=UPI003B21B8BD
MPIFGSTPVLQSLQFAASLVAMDLKKGDTIAIWGANHSEWMITLYACIQLGILLDRICNFQLHCKAIVLMRSPSDLLDKACECFAELKGTPAEQFKSDSCPHLQFVINCGNSKGNIFWKRGVYSYDDFMTLGNETDISKVEEICKSLDIDDPLCMYFTSGSTGIPKPAVHSHHSILNNAMTGGFRSDVNVLDCDWESLRLMQVATFAAVNSWLGTYLPIVRGSTSIVLFPTFNAQIMAEALQNERVTCGPTLIHHVHDLVNLPNIDSYDFSNFKQVSIGGSIIPHKLRQKMGKIAKHTTNRYGMAEILLSHCGDPLDPPEKIADAAVYPTAGLETKIVDDKGIIVPVNTVGNLLVRGYTSLKYYLNNEQKTKEIKDNNGWIHTG